MRSEPTPAASAGADDPAAAMIGRRLGDFIVRARLAEGGGGTVYLAEQPGLDREAVIKILHADPAARDLGERFLREVRFASRLDHPYAAHIYAFGAEPDGVLWLAMERVRGTTLAELLRSGGPLPPARLAALLQRICEVVHAAHQQQIIHRDLKPANVMVVSRSGRLMPKLLDFGIAALPRATTPSPAGGDRFGAGVVVGTLHYMAPEQWVDPAAADPRTDVYALGVIAHECLTGRVPYDGHSERAIGRAHLTSPIPVLDDRFPAPLAAAVARALSKRPGDRFPSALALADAVAAAAGLDGERAGFPELDPDISRAAVTGAPQPLAEAVALLGAARNLHQARDATLRIVHVAVRYLATVAMACRARTGDADDEPPADARALLSQVATRALPARDWLALTRALCRPFRDRRDAHPIPELVELCWPEAGPAPVIERFAGLLERLDGDAAGAASDAAIHGFLAAALPVLAQTLRGLQSLWSYRVVVPEGERGEEWMGAHRRRRALVVVRGAAPRGDGAAPVPSAPPAGRDGLPASDPAVLVDELGAPVVALWPLVQIASPSPGAPAELFLFDGGGPRGPRLVAQPHGYERVDERVRDWLRTQLLADTAREVGVLDEDAPFRGLLPFRREDAAWFVGRDRAVDAFCNRLRAHPLLAVVGASGVGKSSFVHAGVLPRLPPEWTAITVRPGLAPLAGLAARLEAAGLGTPPLREVMQRDPGALGAALRDAATRRGTIVLVIDQFEELLTLGADPAERARYAAALAAAAGSADDPVRVILTVRDDFLAAAGELPELGPRLALGLEILTPPSRDELRRMLIEPIERTGYQFDDAELPAQMIRELPEGAGALPLLSFTAARLWAERDRQFKLLRRRSYDALGGVAGALSRHAEAVLAGMSGVERRLVHAAFARLISAGGTRVVATRRELADVLDGGRRGERVIERLIESRLLIAREGDAGEEQIEIIHEALIESWPRLVAWRREAAEGARLRDQLRVAAQQWDQRGRPPGLLWRGDALVELRLWLRRSAPRLTAVEAAFAAASERDATRGKRLRRALVVTSLITLSAALALVLWMRARTDEQRARAERSAAEATRHLQEMRIEQGRQAHLRGQSLTALVYLEEAYQLGARSPTLQYLLGAAGRVLDAQLLELAPGGDWIRDAAFTPDGARVVTGTLRGVGAIWDAATGARLHPLPDGAFSLALDGPGARLAAGGLDGGVRIVEVATGRELRALRGHTGAIRCLRFHPDGRQLLTAGADGVARVWDLATGARLHELAHGERDLHDCDFSADGTTILTTSASTRLWRAATGAPIATVGPAGERADASFSPDGALVAVANLSSREVLIARAGDGATVHTLRGHAEGVPQVRWSPDGRRVVTASRDRSAKVWRADTGLLVTSLDGHAGLVLTAVFDPDGRTIATGSSDQVALWDATSGRKLASLVGHVDNVPSIAWSPDGRRLVTGSFDGTARIWSAAPAGRVLGFDAPPQVIVAATYAPDGARVLTQDQDQGAALWDAATGRKLADFAPGAPTAIDDWQALQTFRVVPSFHPDGTRVALPRGPAVDLVRVADGAVETTLAGPEGKVAAAQWSRTGDRVLTVAGDAARTWRFPGGAPEHALRHPHRVLAADLSPDGTAIATACLDGVVRIWDADRGALRHALEGHRFGIVAVDFAPDGRRLVSASPDGTARVWDTASGRLLVTAVAGQPLCSIAFAPDGARLAGLECGGTAHLWDADSGLLLESRVTARPRGLSIELSPDGARLLIAHGGVEVLDVGLDRRTPREWADVVRTRVPLRLDGERVVPR